MDNKVEETKKVFWELVKVDEDGDFIVKVYNPEKQKKFQQVCGTKKEQQAEFKKAFDKAVLADDKYADLVELLGYEASIEMFSTAGKSYIYNMKREMIKDAKANQKTEALHQGAQRARESKPRAVPVEKTTMIVTEEGVW